jgi:hypothetical protein
MFLQGYVWMGVMVCGMTQLIPLLWWPQWGGMLCGPRKGATEEEYYCRDFNEAEKEAGLHRSVMKFVSLLVCCCCACCAQLRKANQEACLQATVGFTRS